MRIAVIGVGVMGARHARAIHESPVASLAGVVDMDASKAAAVGASYGVPHSSTVQQALKLFDADAYVVSTPDNDHENVTIEVLESGRPVLLEKPIATSLTSARAIAQASTRTGTRLMVGHILRFDPRYVSAAAHVAGGDLGSLIHVTGGRNASRRLGMRLGTKTTVSAFLGIHDVDALQWVTGSAITTVKSTSCRSQPSRGITGGEAVISLLEFGNGAVGTLFSGWSRVDGDPHQMDGRLELHGTRGSVTLNAGQGGIETMLADRFTLPDIVYWPAMNGHLGGAIAAELDSFISASTHDRPFAISVGEAVRAVAVVEAIERSLTSGQEEPVETIDIE